MKIYTYYENIDFNHQDRLLDFWKSSWEIHGVDAIVLTQSDVQNHPFYEEFLNRLEQIHIKLTNNNPSKYVLSCWVRWLAYSTQKEEKFYVSDYDVINHNFKPMEPEDVLCLLDGNCPCIASGTPSQFYQLLKDIINFSENHFDILKAEYDQLYYIIPNGERRLLPYHDQTFFQICKKINPNLVKMSRNRQTFLGTPLASNFWEKQVVHYGYSSCIKYCEQNNIKYQKHESKTIVIEKYLKL